MVRLVIVARFELILLKPAKGFLAFISLHLIGNKGVSAYLALNTCSLYSYLTFTAGVLWVLTIQVDLNRQQLRSAFYGIVLQSFYIMIGWDV